MYQVYKVIFLIQIPSTAKVMGPYTTTRAYTFCWSDSNLFTYTHRQKLSNTTIFSETLFWKV